MVDMTARELRVVAGVTEGMDLWPKVDKKKYKDRRKSDRLG